MGSEETPLASCVTWVDPFSENFRIEKCTPYFTSVCGPCVAGRGLLDMVCKPGRRRFISQVEEQARRIISSPDTRARDYQLSQRLHETICLQPQALKGSKML